MKLSDIFELLTYDVVLSALGTVFAVGLIWNVIFGGWINPIIELLIEGLG